MKKFGLLFVFSLLFTCISYSQVTNLSVDSVSSNFSMVSGNQISWNYDVPNPGDSTLVEIWIDTDQNGQFDPSKDMIWNYFVQIDGDSQGHNGPPDMDGQANGQVTFAQNVGLAPGHYIMVFKNHNIYKYVAGQVTALSSPTFTISGHVNVPNGYSSQYISLNLEATNGNMFWTGLTDVNGNFTIQMNSDTTGNPWKLRIDNQVAFGASVVSPDRIYLTLDAGDSTTYGGNNFTISSAAASINGMLKDENGNPLVNFDVYANDSSNTINRSATTDTSGAFHLGILANELPVSTMYVGVGDSYDTNFVAATYNFSSINQGDSLTHDFTLFSANSTISGKVTVGGNSPSWSINVFAYNSDSSNVQTMTDANGNYVLHVSSLIYNYSILLGNYPSGYNFQNPIAHAGDTNVNIDLTLTGVKQISSNIPKKYSLSQNFPNPFNPSTIIRYDIPKSSFVHLTVYNILGQEVAELVNKEQSAGSYSAIFNASNFSSGIYFYRLQAGNFVQIRKSLLLK